MGVDKFYKTLTTMPIMQNIIISTNKIKVNYLYIEINYIIYKIEKEIENDLNYLLFSIIEKKYDDKTHKIATKLNFSLENTTPEQFNIFFLQNDILVQIIIHNIEKYINNIITTYTTKNDIETIFISFDGIPQMSKIIEQKKRKYNDYIISEIKKIISNNSTLKNDFFENKKTFEHYKTQLKNVLDWNMLTKKLLNHLNELDIYKFAPNLINYIISNNDISGEGEKKIMEHILNINKKQGTYMICSPDNDVILLSMLGTSILDNTNFILLNDIENKVDLIDINTINKNFSTSIRKNKYMTSIYEIHDKNIIYDLIVIFTLFGNDFIPKMESINVYNIDMLINQYCYILSNFGHLVNQSNSLFSLNYINLFHYLENISTMEHELLVDTYLKNNCRDYKELVKISENNSVYTAIINYVDNVNNNKTESIYFKKWALVVESMTENNKLSINITNKSEKDINKFFKSILQFGNLKIREINSQNDNIIKSDNITGEYFDKIVIKKINLGKIEINYINKKYVISYSNYYKNILQYYTNNFNIIGQLSDETYFFPDKNQLDKLYHVIDKYLQGIIWIFDHYFNKNNFQYNGENISTWFYPYYKTPLLKDIINRLSSFTTPNEYINHMKNLEKYNEQLIIKKENYINFDEQFMYINPAEIILQKFPEKKEFIELYPNIFVKMTPIINNMFFNDKYNNKFDCNNASYLNKCTLPFIENISFDKYKQIFNKSDQFIGGSIYYKNYYKKLYLKTKNIKYKTLYKQYKIKINF